MDECTGEREAEAKFIFALMERKMRIYTKDVIPDLLAEEDARAEKGAKNANSTEKGPIGKKPDHSLAVIINGDFNCDPVLMPFPFNGKPRGGNGPNANQSFMFHPEKNPAGMKSLKPYSSQDEYTIHMHTNDWVTKKPIQILKQLDYIFFQPKDLRVAWDVQVPKFDEIAEVIGDKGLPNESHPSDHLSLCCRFVFN